MDYVNMFSRGVGRVQEMLHENGNGDAIFDLDKITVFNVIIKENPEDAALAAAQTRGEKPAENTSVKASVKTSVKASVKTSVKILELLLGDPSMSMVQLAVETGRTLRAIEMACSKLVKKGHLRRVGPDNGGHWEVIGKV
jgi:predicted HTH transcriptional regulator